MGYRIASAALGVWLAMSIYLVPEPPGRGFANLCIGLLLFTSGLCGVWIRSLRWFDMLLGLSLIFGSVALVYSGTRIGLHQFILGVAVVILATPGGRDGRRYLDHWVSRFDLDPYLWRPR
ncbi:MAG: hypothetical protein JST54_10900 [Deltaproteobacteria bacterium]|nr:hypothetical protein [Deltaproteobacteria bacterium]